MLTRRRLFSSSAVDDGFQPLEEDNTHRYRGHRADSFFPEDVDEIIELRARQRTFDGAYARTALVNFGYALTILRLFDKSFARIGLVYTVLGVALTAISFFRHRHARHDFADVHRKETWQDAILTVGQTGQRNYGRPFVTAGWIVVAVTLVVAAVEISLLVLVFDAKITDS
ncbi:uncharacterized protein C8Q71DRAFT_754380 [Rhodofomes roseus]|uniref:DUF202 domain-containing protein n=1 Tax=Rhodofomes roseus TaxID=34475 RepID=A0A4Y9XQ84_9APHY|nr:uncharacterized protein C8Q71DRAFT_754380 [Rhodofomes roseus]KAH9837770.1 hypothetical protein C8Q71DRAFT_754380 [Rhodofomes roseus]TFY51938.1 hypothetical protein EVJ58_g10295 [Rhodofomes roseus]